jgi:DNA ligase 1
MITIKTRYTLDSKDRIRIWKCWPGQTAEFVGMFSQDGIEGGKMKDPVFKKATEKNVGKANYISAVEQSYLMVEQAVGKKERNNYFSTKEDARNNKAFRPMLAHKYEDKFKKLGFPCVAQPKLDGARCNAVWEDGRVILYSRTGKEFVSCPHISAALHEILSNNQTLILDGELYNHELRNDFEEIMSLIRQTKPREIDFERSAALVQFHVYDCYLTDAPEMDFLDRGTIVGRIPMDYDGSPIKYVETLQMDDQEELDTYYSKWTEEGYEGQMVRGERSVYKVDGRSAELLKRKEFHDMECKILDVIEGEGTWAGKAAKITIELPNGDTQDAGFAKGWNHDKCADFLQNKDDVIGKMATIEYFELTSYGALRFPKFKAVRDYE